MIRPQSLHCNLEIEFGYFVFVHIWSNCHNFIMIQLLSNYFVIPVSVLLQCKHCRIFISKTTESVVEHSKLCHDINRSDMSYFYTCVFCEYHTSFKHSMTDHVRKHLNQKPYQCALCPYKSTQASNLRRHVNIHHNTKAILPPDGPTIWFYNYSIERYFFSTIKVLLIYFSTFFRGRRFWTVKNLY